MKRFFELRESSKKTAVFTFGRFNPPTVGHQKLIEKVIQVAKSNNADSFVFLSGSNDKKKNPLEFKEKLNLVKKMFPKFDVFSLSNQKPSTAMHVASLLHSKGYTKLIMVVGSDRVSQFGKLLPTYNGVKDKPHGFYDFETIDIVSAGERDPDADGVSGMSASKLRQLVIDGDFDTFKKGVPDTLNDNEKRKMYQLLRKRMSLSVIENKISKSLNKTEKISDLDDLKSTSKFREIFKEQITFENFKTNNLGEEATILFKNVKNSSFNTKESIYILKSLELCETFHKNYFDIKKQNYYKTSQVKTMVECQKKINDYFTLIEEMSGMSEFTNDKLDFLEDMIRQSTSFKSQLENTQLPVSDQLKKYLLKNVVDEQVYEDGTKEYANHVKQITPGQEAAENGNHKMKNKIVRFLRSKK